MVHEILTGSERARLQTVEEWLLEYKTGKPVMLGTFKSKELLPQNTPILRYNSHRTTRDGRLVMAFIDTKTEREVDSFFNVDIERKYGIYKGKKYRTGVGGQFNVGARSNFYKFWIYAVGAEPARWCRVHKEMKSKLKDMLFTGELSTRYDKNSSPYMQVKSLKIYSTTQAQIGHKLGTMWAHLRHIKLAQ